MKKIILLMFGLILSGVALMTTNTAEGEYDIGELYTRCHEVGERSNIVTICASDEGALFVATGAMGGVGWCCVGRGVVMSGGVDVGGRPVDRWPTTTCSL